LPAHVKFRKVSHNPQVLGREKAQDFLVKSRFGKKRHSGFFLLVLLLSACRAHGNTTAQVAASPKPSSAPVFFGIPVGMLPVNVVGSYGGGTNFARRIGAGKHPVPSGIGVPLAGSSTKQSTWACSVLLYGSGAAVQYEGRGHCGMGKQPSNKKSAVCEIPLPKNDPKQSKGVVGVGWCMPDIRPKVSLQKKM
jgi:hypothetical protein